MPQLGSTTLGSRELGGGTTYTTVSATASHSTTAETDESIRRRTGLTGTARHTTSTETDLVRLGPFIPQTLGKRFDRPLRREADSLFRRWLAAQQTLHGQRSDDLVDVLISRQITEASDKDLDRIGKQWGELGRRRGRNDEAYRPYLMGITQSFQGRGTVPGIKFAVAAGLRAQPDTVEVDEHYDALEYSLKLTKWRSHPVASIVTLADLADASGSRLRTPITYEPSGMSTTVGFGPTEDTISKPVQMEGFGPTVRLKDTQITKGERGIGSGILGDGTQLGPEINPGTAATAHIDFDGVDDYVDAPHTAMPSPLGEVTFTAWVKAPFKDISGSLGRYFGADGAGAGTYINITNTHSRMDLQLAISNSIASASAFPAPTTPPNDQWIFVHKSVSYNGTEYRIAAGNDASWKSSNSLTAGVFTPNDLNVGRLYGNHFPGEVDDFRVYNRVLSESELRRVRRGETLGDEQLRYTFDSRPTTTVPDESGNGHDGTIVGNPGYGLKTRPDLEPEPTVDTSLAMDFDATNDYISAPPSAMTAAQGFGESGTWSMWVRLPTTSTADPAGMRFFNSEHTAGNNSEFRSYRDGWIIQTTGTTAASGAYPPTEIPANTWTLVHGRWQYDSATDTTTVTAGHGSSFGTASGAGKLVLPDIAIQIGLWGASDYPGDLDDFRLYSRHLSDAEIATLAGGGDIQQGLHIHYPMDTPSALTARDATGNGHNGTVNGNPAYITRTL